MVKHESERFTLYCADAADVLSDFTSDSVHLIATDPPYGVRWQSNARQGHKFAPIVNDGGGYDSIAVIAAYQRRALFEGRHLYVFGAKSEDARERLLLGGACDLVWDKGHTGMGDLALPWGPAHEVILFGAYRPSKKHREGRRGGLAARLRSGSVLRAHRPHGLQVVRHPTEKPVSLMRQIVESSSVADEVVLDMFAGSGSTLAAAILCGRKAIGIEVVAEYYETALARCLAAESLWRAANGV